LTVTVLCFIFGDLSVFILNFSSGRSVSVFIIDFTFLKIPRIPMVVISIFKSNCCNREYCHCEEFRPTY